MCSYPASLRYERIEMLKLVGRTKVGGLALFVNNRRCSPGHVTVKTVICCRDSELLTVGLRPYYVPREFSHIVAVVFYVPPRADPAVACDITLKSIARLQTLHPDALIVRWGDYNHVDISPRITGFTQYDE